jgi:hypothetical protein
VDQAKIIAATLTPPPKSLGVRRPKTHVVQHACTPEQLGVVNKDVILIGDGRGEGRRATHMTKHWIALLLRDHSDSLHQR